MKSKWITKDGREIPIKKLEDSHLISIIKMLRRKAEQVKLYLELTEIQKLSPFLIDSDFEEIIIQEIMDKYDKLDVDHIITIGYPLYGKLLKELKRRKLVINEFEPMWEGL